MVRLVGDKAEFVKDIIAMANNAEPSYLVIGLEDGTFSAIGKLSHHYTKNDLNQILSDKIDPPVIVDYAEYQINGYEYALIKIFGNNPPYLVSRDLIHNKSDRKRVRIYKGMIYVRHEDRTEGVSRSELDGLLDKGLRKIFKDETERAKELVYKKPDFWEYLLTGELLRKRITKTKQQLNELERGLIYKKTKILTGHEFLNWARARLTDLNALIHILMLLITKEIQKSWGEDGVSGNIIEIKYVADKLYSTCEDLVEWEAEIQSVTPPDSFIGLKKMMEGWSKEIFSSIQLLPEKILEPFENPDPFGQYIIKIVFEPPSNIEEVSREIERLTNNPMGWIDGY